MRKTLQYATASGSEHVRQDQLDYSKNTDFLRFAMVVPNDKAEHMIAVYESLIERGLQITTVTNKLLAKTHRGEHAMYVLLNCRLSQAGIIKN